MNWKSFLLGVAAGGLVILILVSRYSVTVPGANAAIIKLDRWTGRSWLAMHHKELDSGGDSSYVWRWVPMEVVP